MYEVSSGVLGNRRERVRFNAPQVYRLHKPVNRSNAVKWTKLHQAITASFQFSCSALDRFILMMTQNRNF